MTPEDFWNRVDRTTDAGGCWRWRGTLNAYGYGVFGGRNTMAHRHAYELLVGPIPKGLVIDHLCRVRDCVNPGHMEPVTRGENVKRGVGFAAANAAKTECPAGHPYDEENTYYRRDRFGRHCKKCDRLRPRKGAA